MLYAIIIITTASKLCHIFVTLFLETITRKQGQLKHKLVLVLRAGTHEQSLYMYQLCGDVMNMFRYTSCL